MNSKIEFDERELAEIALATYYALALHHGTAGHNRLMLISKLAEACMDSNTEVAMAVKAGSAATLAHAGALAVEAAKLQG